MLRMLTSEIYTHKQLITSNTFISVGQYTTRSKKPYFGNVWSSSQYLDMMCVRVCNSSGYLTVSFFSTNALRMGCHWLINVRWSSRKMVDQNAFLCFGHHYIHLCADARADAASPLQPHVLRHDGRFSATICKFGEPIFASSHVTLYGPCNWSNWGK